MYQGAPYVQYGALCKPKRGTLHTKFAKKWEARASCAPPYGSYVHGATVTSAYRFTMCGIMFTKFIFEFSGAVLAAKLLAKACE